jgi:hypothetical protein
MQGDVEGKKRVWGREVRAARIHSERRQWRGQEKEIILTVGY